MNEQLKELAEDSGMEWDTHTWCWLANPPHLEKFAEFVRQDERDKCAQDYLQDCCDAIAVAEHNEREACAKTVAAELRRQHEEIKCEERRFSELWEQFAALDKTNQMLLDALKSVVAFCDEDMQHRVQTSREHDIKTLARAAIAKVEGKTK